MGIYNVTNNVPIDVQMFGAENKGKEVKIFMNYVKSNLDTFKNVIFVADRLYFLSKNDLKFIIRAK